MKDFLKRLTELLGQLTGIKGGLPDQNSLERGSVVAAQTANLNTSIAAVETLCREVEAELKKADELLAAGPSAEVKQSIIDAAVAAGEVLKKSDADAAKDIAVKEKETELQKAFDEEKAALGRESANRKALADALTGVPAEALSKLPAEVLGAEDIAPAKAKIGERMKQLKDLGIGATSVLSEVLSLGIDEAADQIFETRVAGWKELASNKGNGGGASFSPGSAGGGGGGGGGGSKPTGVMI